MTFLGRGSHGWDRGISLLTDCGGLRSLTGPPPECSDGTDKAVGGILQLQVNTNTSCSPPLQMITGCWWTCAGTDNIWRFWSTSLTLRMKTDGESFCRLWMLWLTGRSRDERFSICCVAVALCRTGFCVAGRLWWWTERRNPSSAPAPSASLPRTVPWGSPAPSVKVSRLSTAGVCRWRHGL